MPLLMPFPFFPGGGGHRCSEVAAPEMLRKAKPLSTQPILYVSTQMRVLRALKKAGLDFSKVLYDAVS